MDSNSGKDPFFSDSHSKKTEQSTTPVKRPRQKQLQFDLVPPMQQPSLNNNNNTLSEFTPQIPSNYEDMSFSTPVTTPWCNDGGGGGGLPPRRDTPVPESEGVVQSEDALWEEIQSFLEGPTPEQRPSTGLQSWTPKRTQRQVPPAPSFNRLDGIQGPGMMPMNYQLMNEASLSDLPMHPSFSASRSERARFLEMMNPHPPVFDPSPRSPPVDHLPLEATPSVYRKTPIPSPDRLVGEEEIYDEFPTFNARDWSSGAGTTAQGKTPVSPLGMDHRFRGPRRPRMPSGMRQEPTLNSFVTRHNTLFDIGYSDPTPERNPGRISIMRERLRRLDHRQSPLEESREQEFRATMERHRNRPSLRDRRSPYRGSEFGALMSALGLVPDDENPREANSGISRMREAMVGIVNSRLPPHLLFSDRDFDGDDYEFLSRLDDSIESKKGADDQIINKIDLCSFKPGIGGGVPVNLAESAALESRCPICLEDFTSGAELRVMPCQHKYHRCCLDKWLKINAVCPICNMNVKDKFDEGQNHHN